MTARAWRVGRAVVNGNTDGIALWGRVGATNNYMTLHHKDVDYFIPSGYDLHIVKLDIMGGAANCNLFIGYGDDAVSAGVTAPTNPINMTHAYGGATAFEVYSFDAIDIIIPQSKYPFLLSYNGSSEWIVNANGILVANT